MLLAPNLVEVPYHIVKRNHPRSDRLLKSQFKQYLKQTMDSVKTLKQALEKELPLDGADVERCQDLLARLEEIPISFDILADTMIGKTVSSFKKHDILGTKAKSLVKKWKQIAKSHEESAGSQVAAAAPPKPSPKAAKKIVKKKPLQRQSSTASDITDLAALAAAETEWEGLDDQRKIICKKFWELGQSAKAALVADGINASAVDQLVAPRAAEIEGAVWIEYAAGGAEKKAYASKARSLYSNLKKNMTLTQRVLLGQVPAETLAKLKSEDLASEETKQARQEQAKKLIDSKRLDWEQANESKINEMCGIKGELLKASLFTCGRCKSTKTTSTQKQTRSADEPMTVFVLCLNCGKRWKC